MAEIGVSLGGGGYDEVDITARAGDVLQGKTTLDASGEITNGTIPQRNDSGNRLLNTGTTSTSYAGGYYPNAHGAYINTQSKTVTAGTGQTSVGPDSNYVLSGVTINPTPSQGKSAGCSTSAQTIYPDSGYLLSSVSISAIPSQHSDSGDAQLYNGRSTYTYGAGWYHYNHGAYVDVFNW